MHKFNIITNGHENMDNIKINHMGVTPPVNVWVGGESYKINYLSEEEGKIWVTANENLKVLLGKSGRIYLARGTICSSSEFLRALSVEGSNGMKNLLLCHYILTEAQRRYNGK